MKLEEQLRQLTTDRKAKRLKSLWPTIEEKLAEGVTHAEILRLLNETGFELSERTYKSYLYRYRKRRRTLGQQSARICLAENTAPQSGGASQAATFPASAEIEKHKRPPTFDFNPSGIPELL
jgi:proline dehydrogenase